MNSDFKRLYCSRQCFTQYSNYHWIVLDGRKQHSLNVNIYYQNKYLLTEGYSCFCMFQFYSDSISSIVDIQCIVIITKWTQSSNITWCCMLDVLSSLAPLIKNHHSLSWLWCRAIHRIQVNDSLSTYVLILLPSHDMPLPDFLRIESAKTEWNDT